MIEYYLPNSELLGKSYGSWTCKWWQWALGIPTLVNPLIDSSGACAHISQPDGVWYLAGKLGDEDKTLPERRCSVPVGRSILFPVLNCEANPLEYPELKTDDDLINHVSRDINSVIVKNCRIDGEDIPAQRVKSEPKIFELRIHKNNAFGVQGGGLTKATSDGYWVFLKPPPKGEYTIQFYGTCENGRLYSGANYHIVVG